MIRLDRRRKLLMQRLPEKEREAFSQFRAMLSAELKRVRKDADVSIAEAAKRMGVTKKTVMEWEAGAVPSVETLAVYCRLLGKTFSAILFRAGE